MAGAITFLLTDVEGSTRLWEREARAMPRALARHDELAEQAIAVSGGSVIKPRGEGDSIFSVFHDAAGAAAGAVAFQRALHEETWPEGCAIRVRMALHTGAAELRAGDYYGPAVNRAARLRAIGHGRQILLSRPTYEAIDGRLPEGCRVRDLGVHRLKDLSVPEHVHQLLGPGIPEEFPPLASLEPHRTNLPSHTTTFVDREKEVAELEELLEDSRLVTLTGPPGVGKTRLAMHVGAEVIDRFADGVWHVDAAALTVGEAIVTTTAAVLAVRPDRRRTTLETIVSHLAGTTTLLVLDNCDHLLHESAALVRVLLAGCPATSVLVTSQEPLGVPGELVWETPPLGGSPALELFADRTGARQEQADAGAVAEICRRLAGVPLAIELVAALTGGATDGGLGEHGPAIEPLLDRTHDALAADERAALRRLSVFSGPFASGAAERVLADLDDPLGTLAALVSRSLVAYDPAAPAAPYRMGPAVRRHAHGRLQDAGEAGAAAAAHAGWHLEAAESGALAGGAAHPDVHKALRWSIEERPADALRMCVALEPHWSDRGRHVEGVQAIESALQAAPDDARVRARALAAAGRLAGGAGDAEHGRELLEKAAEAARASGDAELLAELSAG